MRGLSLTQPWATLVAIGAKRIETRDWPTAYRGELAVHAAKNLAPVGGPAGVVDICLDEPFRGVLLRAGKGGLVVGEDLPVGAIVAVAELADCVKITRYGDPDALQHYHAYAAEHERAFGNWEIGRYMWLLRNVRALPTPVPCRGYPNVWPMKDELLAAVQRQLEGAVPA